MSGNELNVSVKPLEWKDLGFGFLVAQAPLFGNIRVEHYGDEFTVSYSIPGYSNTFAEGEFFTVEKAKAAAEAEYERRILSALSQQPVTPPVAWVIPGDDNGNMHGFIDAMAWEEGEFTRPLYASPQPVTKPAMGEGWMPIETAPKGKREDILIFDRGVVRIVWWGAAAYNRKTKEYELGWTNGATFGFSPSHWMPLPAPPATGGEEL
jgi:hypothetical protein